MAEWAPSFIVDGDMPGSAGIDTLLANARLTINDLDREALRRGAVNRFLSPVTIPAGNPQVISWSGAGTHTYSDAALVAAIRYTTFGGTADRTVIGSSGTGAVNPPDAAVSLNSGTGYLLNNRGTGTGNVGFILAMFNVDIVNIVDANVTADAMICLQYRVTGGVWRTLSKTERLISRDTHKILPTSANENMWADGPIKTTITETTLTNDGLDPATVKVTGVRAACSIRGGTAGASVLHLGSYRLSAIPILSTMTVT